MAQAKHYSKEQRAAWVIEDLEKHGPCLTAKEIAELQGMKKAPGILAIIEGLVLKDKIVVQWAMGSNRQRTQYYSLPEQAPKLFEVEK